MDIRISRKGEQFGPYPEAVARQYLEEGTLAVTDLAWHAGADGWKPLGEVLGIATQPPPEPTPPPSPAVEPPPATPATSGPPPATPAGDSEAEPGDADEIFITRKGQQIGPAPRAKAMELFTAGKLVPTDWGWHDGMEEWKPLYEVLGMEVPAQITAAASPLSQSTVSAGSKESSLNPHAIDCFACGMIMVIIIFAQMSAVFTSIVSVNIDPKIPVILAWVLVVAWFFCRSLLVKDYLLLGEDFGKRGTFEFIFKVYSIVLYIKAGGAFIVVCFSLAGGGEMFLFFLSLWSLELLFLWLNTNGVRGMMRYFNEYEQSLVGLILVIIGSIPLIIMNGLNVLLLVFIFKGCSG